MTISQLLNLSVEELEAMSDDQLREYLEPVNRVVENLKPAAKLKSGVIDTTQIEEKGKAKKMSVESYIDKMTKMFQAQLDSVK